MAPPPLLPIIHDPNPGNHSTLMTDMLPAKTVKRPRRRTYLPASERRQLILAAAQEVFARSNLKGARTRDIAKAADVNQATLFEHFESKEALFHEAVIVPLLEAMDGMKERARAYEAAGSPAEIASMAQESARRNLEMMDKVFPLLMAALFSDPDIGRALYRDHVAPLLTDRSEAISGIVRSPLDPGVVELAMFGGLLAIAMNRHFTGDNSDLGGIAAQFTDFATRGFAKSAAAD
jgi:AcrR family transcriptional regulator